MDFAIEGVHTFEIRLSLLAAQFLFILEPHQKRKVVRCEVIINVELFTKLGVFRSYLLSCRVDEKFELSVRAPYNDGVWPRRLEDNHVKINFTVFQF